MADKLSAPSPGTVGADTVGVFEQRIESMLDFAALLSPGTVEAFIDEQFEKQPHVVRGDRGRFAALFSIDDVDAAVAAAPAPGGGSTSSAYGFRYTSGVREDYTFNADTGRSNTAAHRAYDEGFTVIANAVRQTKAEVARLAMSMESVLQHRVDTNMYLTPPAARGFPPHIDQHDTLLVQIDGAKRWSIWNPDQELPLTGSTEFDNPPLREPDMVVDLTAGDALYIPHGWWHCGVTGEELSLHLTFGVISLKWVDLLLASIRLVADGDIRLRQSLPLNYSLSFDEMVTEIGEQAGSMLRSLATIQQRDDVSHHVLQVLLADRIDSQTAPFENRMQSTIHRKSLLATDVVEHRQGLRGVVLDIEGGCQLKFVGGFVSGPASARSALEFIVQTERFCATDLPGLSEDFQLQLVHELVLQGMVRPADETRWS